MIPRDRQTALTETTSRTLEWARAQAKIPGKLSVEELINETLYFERQRLKGPVASPHKDEDAAFWRGISRDFPSASGQTQVELLRQVSHRYSDEIIGHFNPLIFRALTQYGARSLSLVLQSMSPLKLMDAIGNMDSVDDNIRVVGEVAAFKALATKGTIILAPTHVSHLDAPVLGYALARLGLPPFLYGAGYNLFKNPIFAPFLKRLGAYTVDRQKKAPLYKQVLKTFATVSMEMGYHHIFFPGGTRSRSGRLETKLKKGLLGCGIEAYETNLRRNKPKPNIYIVPCTLSYQMVLEGETLVADYLAEAGKARYIIEDDESSRVDRMVSFVRAILRHQSAIHMHIGQALDPFGNRVLPTGESVDNAGRTIAIDGYLRTRGELNHDAQRNEEFTSELAHQLTLAYPKGNVIGSTQIVAYVLFEMLKAEAQGASLYRVLRDSEMHTGFLVDTVRGELGALIEALRKLAAQRLVQLEQNLDTASTDEVLSRALIHYSVYHAEAAVERRGDRVFVLNRPLLFYYRNRLDGYELGKAKTGATHG